MSIMKLHLIIILFLGFASLCFGQTPSASPMPAQSASTENTNTNTKTKTFGSSLEKYKNKKPQNSQQKSKTEESDDEEVIRLKTDLVVNDILVTDRDGKVITDLKKEDFIVTENGVAQTIEVFSLGEKSTVSRSIVLIIDNTFRLEFPYLSKSVQAAKFLVDKLNPEDKMAIVTGDIKLLADFTTDKTLLKNTLDSLEKNRVSGGGGFEFETLLAVLNEMLATGDKHPIIIFQGSASEIVRIKTGDDTLWRFYSTFTRTEHLKDYRYLEFSDIKEAVEKSRATIYSVVTGIRFLGFSKKEQLKRARKSIENISKFMFRDEYRRSELIRTFQESEVKRQIAAQTAMSEISELSGGSIGFIEKPEDAENVYANIFENIKNRYVIGYYPTNQKQDGKRREVKIEIRNHPEYIVTGRRNYLPR